MSGADSWHDLRVLDDGQTLSLDPGIWDDNIAALATVSPATCDAVRSVELPRSWRLVRGIDGGPAWRIDEPGQDPSWLSGTAAPQTRAEALLSSALSGDANIALPAIGDGFELRWLLDRLAPHRAVFVFDPDMRCLAAALRTHDVAADLREGRAVPIADRHPAEALVDVVLAQPGLLAPATIIALPTVSADWLHAVRAACVRAAQESVEARRRSVERATTGWQADAEHDPRRIAFVCPAPLPLGAWVAGRLARAAESAAWRSACVCIDGPRTADPWSLARAIAEFRPSVTVSIDRPITALPIARAGIVCRLHLREPETQPSPTTDATLHLAATPRIASALRDAGVPTDRIVDFYWACDAGATEPIARRATDAHRARAPQSAGANANEAGTVVIVADAPDASADTCRITQPTHRILWDQLRKTISQGWETAEAARPEALLIRAERACGLSIREDEIRRQFLRVLSHRLIPRIVAERIYSVLAARRCRLVAAGEGWEDWPNPSPRRIGERWVLSHVESLGSAPVAAVFAGVPDPLGPDLLHCAAAAVPIFIFSPGGSARVAELADVLHPNEHYVAFGDADGLLRRLEETLDTPAAARRRAERAAAHVQREHTWSQRIDTLLRRAPALRGAPA